MKDKNLQMDSGQIKEAPANSDIKIDPNRKISLTRDLEELHRTKKDKFILAAYSILKNYEESEDSVQEAFLSAFANIESFQEKSSLATWVYRILVNHCLKKNQNRLKEIKYIENSDEKAYNCADYRQNQAFQLEKEEIHNVISDCFDKLDMNFRLPLILYHYIGFGIESIAFILDIPQGTVKSRLHVARRKMGFLLERAFGGKEVLEDFIGLF